MDKWQPIDTAPKDGTEILTYAYTNMRVALWDDYTRDWRCNVHSFVQINPSHWMPLPPPPEPS